MTVTEYSVANLSCSAESAPPPIIEWLFNSSSVKVSKTKAIDVTEPSMFIRNSVLTLNNVSRLDIGFYQCIANNSVSQAAFLDVFCKFKLTKRHKRRLSNILCYSDRPHAIVSPPSVFLQMNKRTSFNLTCLVQGNPKPNVTWLRTGLQDEGGESEPLADGEQIFIEDDSRVIRFLNSFANDSGAYVCKASNRAGVTISNKVPVTIQGECNSLDIPVV